MLNLDFEVVANSGGHQHAAPGEGLVASLSQTSANVNPFLRYAAPTDSRTKLPAGTTRYTVVVFYGETTVPASFQATFNGTDVRSRFNPMPGSAQAVTFDLNPGSNKLQLSIEGVTTSGRTATDTDTLTLLVQ